VYAERPLRYLGIAALTLAVLSIAAAWLVNPWFSLWRHAYSDLGGPRAYQPWIFNYGLVASGLLTSLYSLWLFKSSLNKFECAGSAFTFIAGLFLALIGMFPLGTDPHFFVSVWFFVQIGLAAVAWGLGLIYRGAKWLGSASLLIVALSVAAASIVKWPSIAALETLGIAAVAAWILLMFKVT